MQHLVELQNRKEVLQMLRKDCEVIRRGKRLELVPIAVEMEGRFNNEIQEVDSQIKCARSKKPSRKESQQD